MNDYFSNWQNNLETGIKYLAEGNFPMAEEYFQNSLTDAEELGVQVIKGFTLRLLASAQVRSNKLNEAESGFRKALEHSLELNNNKGIAEAKAGLAGIFFLRGDYTKSVYLYQQAINIYPVSSSPLRLAVLYSDLGQVYGRMNQWEKAERVLLKAVDLCQKNDFSKGQAEAVLSLGEIYYCQGKKQAAQKMFSLAARTFGAMGEYLSLANVQQYLALLSLDNERMEEALLYQYRATTLYLKYNLTKEISESYYLLSNILQYCGLFDEAEKSIFVSLEYYQGYEPGFAVRYHSLAAIALLKKEYDDAKKFYLEALKYFQYYGDGTKVGQISEALTYLIRNEDNRDGENVYKWLSGGDFNTFLPKYEVMVKLARSLNLKGNHMAAIQCGWKALEIARVMKYDTLETEKIIQNISDDIRKRKKAGKNPDNGLK